MSFMDEWKKDNLCTYFVLPLLRLNKFSFISSNFIESYLTADGRCIIVHVYDTTLISRTVFNHPGYVGCVQNADNTIYIIYTLPPARYHDVQKFIEGKYSKMTETTKDLIRALSTLDYRYAGNDKAAITTDGRLLALERHPALREAYEREFQLDVRLSPDDELLNPPGPRSFIDIKELVVNK